MGPFVFLIFANDLPDVLSANVLLFADDVKLISTRLQFAELHQNLEAVFQWSDDCDLPLNTGKRSNVSIGGTAVSSVDSMKDLGMTVTSIFRTSLHCQQGDTALGVSCFSFAVGLRF